MAETPAGHPQHSFLRIHRHLLPVVSCQSRYPVEEIRYEYVDFTRDSSAASHTGRGEPTGLLDIAGWRREISSKDWEKVLVEAEDEEMVRLLRICTQTGRLLASDSFMSKVQTFLGRRVRPLPVGRQRGCRKDKEGKAGKFC